MSDEEPIVFNLSVEEWNNLMQNLHDKYSPDESLSSSEEVALLEFIEPDHDSEEDEEDYVPPALPPDSEEDYDWATSEDLSN
jgi:hypothetical protein